MSNTILILVDYLLSGVEKVVSSTETTWDDLVVNILRVVRDSEAVRDWLSTISSADTLPNGAMHMVVVPENVVEAFRVRDIPWDKVVAFLPQLLTIIKLFI